jgi:hypothetical protein
MPADPIAPAPPSNNGDALTHHAPLPALTFWQKPAVQQILPLVTSFGFHLLLIALGFLLFSAAQRILAPEVVDQTFVPTTELGDAPNPGGVPNPGDQGDPTRAAAQNVDRTIKESDDWSKNKNKDTSNLSNTGAADVNAATSIMGQGVRSGGSTSGLNRGIGEAGGGMAAFGVPGGGGGGKTKGLFPGVGRGANKIIYVCDASGSMSGQRRALLVRELGAAVRQLKPPQMFNIVFFRNEEPNVFSPQLTLASSANKVKADEWTAEKYEARGSTQPIPAIEAAFKQEPQLIWLLTDGVFDDAAAVEKRIEELMKLNANKLKINTVLFVSSADANSGETRAATESLQKIARIGAGTFRLVREEDLLSE